MVSREELTPRTNESDIENAVDETGIGKFTIKVTIICGLIYLNTGLSIGSVGFILPSAACDLQLSTLDKGQISATPILGMLVGCYFWGCFADIRGRRLALLLALFSYAILEIISSLVTTFWIYLLLKFLSGFAICGQSILVFTYLGEFQSTKIREKVLCWMEMAWTIGLVVLPLIGWIIIPLEFSYVTDKFLFRSWNLFIIVCALPSLLIGFWLLAFPETPKYLAENKQDEKLASALEMMYNQNTGGTFDEYLDTLKKNGHDLLRIRLTLARDPNCNPKEIATDNGKLAESSIVTTRQSFCQILGSLCSQTTKLWKSPHLRSTIIVCGLMYCVASSYYALMLWFPELFQRFAEFESDRPNESSSVCKISSHNRTMSNESMPVCPTTIDSHVYLHTLILGLSCLPVSIILPLFVHKLGYKFYLIFSTTVAWIVTLCFYFVTSSTQNLILSCIFEAFASVCMSIIFCLIVDLFPTNLRALAAALAGFSGRLGALIGNALFGYLIDNYCIPLIGIIAGQLILSTILSLWIPGKLNDSSIR